MAEHLRKPEWLKIKLCDSARYGQTSHIIEEHGLHTICRSGACPNQGECWSRGTASFMIGGEICTRACKFCNTRTGKPLPLDAGEPFRLAESVLKMKLSHVVITSVTRDDLPDQGAEHWANTVSEVRRLNPGITIETLIPDFQGNSDWIARVIASGPNVISHNMETVRRLTPVIRSAARYDVSLRVIDQIARSGITAKSGIMLGLGETTEEVLETMDDLLENGCSVMTMGQYLAPSRDHYPVQEYVHPDRFARYKEIAVKKGFKRVESAPLVRSSYFAERHVL